MYQYQNSILNGSAASRWNGKSKDKTALPGQIQMKKNKKQFEEEMKMANKRMVLTLFVVMVVVPLINFKLGEKMTVWALQDIK